MRDARCTFRVNGTPIEIYGNSSAVDPSAATSIHVWVSPAGSPEVVLVECSNQSPGFSECGAELTPIVLDARIPAPPGQLAGSLQCNVVWTGNGAGEAGCFNPEPCPTHGDLACIKVLGSPLANP